MHAFKPIAPPTLAYLAVMNDYLLSIWSYFSSDYDQAMIKDMMGTMKIER